MPAQISPMLAVSDGSAAIEFYKGAFGAEVLWSLDGDVHAVAGLSIDGAEFFLANDSPPYGTRGPASVGFTTVRIELFVDDPVAVYARAVATGAIDLDPVREHADQLPAPARLRVCCRAPRGTLLDTYG